MAFTGTAATKQISDGIVRITGLSLGAGASGTIGLSGATGSAPEVLLPASFDPEPYSRGGVDITLADMLLAETIPAAVGTATSIPISIVKSGTTDADFRFTLTNTSGTASPLLEIIIRNHE